VRCRLQRRGFFKLCSLGAQSSVLGPFDGKSADGPLLEIMLSSMQKLLMFFRSLAKVACVHALLCMSNRACKRACELLTRQRKASVGVIVWGTLRMVIRCVAMAKITIVTRILPVTFQQINGTARRFDLKVGITEQPWLFGQRSLG